ncbi:MAG: hypothetical protein ABIG63_16210 [Chloroflexota bacterium]
MGDEWTDIRTVEPQEDEWQDIPSKSQYTPAFTSFNAIGWGTIKVKEYPAGITPEVRKYLDFVRTRYGNEIADRAEAPFYIAEIYGVPVDTATTMTEIHQALWNDAKETRGTLQMAKDMWTRGRYNVEMSKIGTQMSSEGLLGNYDNFEKYMAEIERLSAEMPPALDDSKVEWYKRIFLKGIEMGPMMGEAALESVPMALGTAGGFAATAAIAGQLGPQVVLPEELLTVPGAAIAGAIIGGKAGFSASLANQMRGQYMIKQIQEGKDPRIAAWVSLGVGAAQGLIETAQFGKVLNLIPGKAKGIAKILQSATQRFMDTGGVGSKAVAGLARLAGTYTQEMLEEEAQYLVEAFGENLQGAAEQYLTGQYVDKNDAREVLQGIKDTFDQSKEAILGMILGPGAIGIVIDVLTPEAKAAYESGVPVEPAAEEKLIRSMAQEAAEPETFVARVNEVLGDEAVSDEELTAIYEEEKETQALGVSPEDVSAATWYHGTRSDIAVSNLQPGFDDLGVFLTLNKEYAERYTTEDIHGTEGAPLVLEVQANPKNVLDTRFGRANADDLVSVANQMATQIDITTPEWEIKGDRILRKIETTKKALQEATTLEDWKAATAGLYDIANDISMAQDKGISAAPLREAMLAQGYDAMRSIEAGGAEVLVALDPSILRAPFTEGQAQASSELQSDIDMGLFDTAEEFVAFAHTMYDEEALPDDAALREIWEANKPTVQGKTIYHGTGEIFEQFDS